MEIFAEPKACMRRKTKRGMGTLVFELKIMLLLPDVQDVLKVLSESELRFKSDS